MPEEKPRNNILTEEEIIKFWKTNDVGNKSFKSYKVFSILISTFLLIALSIILFVPYRVEEVWGGYNGSINIINYSLIEITFGKGLRERLYGQKFDSLNFIMSLGEFIISLILFILILVMLIKIFTGHNNVFKRAFYIKIYEETKMPVSSKHLSRIDYSIFWIFVVSLYAGIIKSFSYDFQTVGYIYGAFILNLLVCILLYLRKGQYTIIKNEILKTKFYRSNENEVQKM